MGLPYRNMTSVKEKLKKQKMREQFNAIWTSKEKTPYNYQVVKLDGKVARVFGFNTHSHSFYSVGPNSEVFNHFSKMYNN